MRLTILQDQQYECDDYRKIVFPYVPELLTIIVENSQDDKLIQQRFLERMTTVDRAIKTVGIFQAETTFFDVVFDAMDNNEKAQALLEFVNNCIKILKIRGQSKKIKEIVKEMAVNFDQTTSRFYSRVAELACLWEFHKPDEFKVIDIEKKLPNGKSVDIVIAFGNEIIFCDIVSKRFDVEKINSDEDMYNFLYGFLAEKFKNKFQGIDDQYLKNVGIIPVIWSNDGLKPLKQFKAGLERFISDYKNQVFPPYGLVYIKEKKKFYFETVSSLFRVSG